MVANGSPPVPVLTGVQADPTDQASARVTARVASAGVPIAALRWTLCATTCGPAQTVALASDASTATFTVTAPTDGAYTIDAYTLDAAGHHSATVSVPFVLDRATAAVTLPGGSGAAATLPPVVGRRGLRLRLRVRRRVDSRLELDVHTQPRRAGRLRIRLTFAGQPSHRRTLALKHGAATLVVAIPNGAHRLTIVVAGFGASATRHVRLAGVPQRRRRSSLVTAWPAGPGRALVYRTKKYTPDPSPAAW
jgi:hypothetical protein